MKDLSNPACLSPAARGFTSAGRHATTACPIREIRPPADTLCMLLATRAVAEKPDECDGFTQTLKISLDTNTTNGLPNGS